MESLEKIAADDFFDAIEIAWIKNPAARPQVKQLLEIGQLKMNSRSGLVWALAQMVSLLSQGGCL